MVLVSSQHRNTDQNTLERHDNRNHGNLSRHGICRKKYHISDSRLDKIIKIPSSLYSNRDRDLVDIMRKLALYSLYSEACSKYRTNATRD